MFFQTVSKMPPKRNVQNLLVSISSSLLKDKWQTSEVKWNGFDSFLWLFSLKDKQLMWQYSHHYWMFSVHKCNDQIVSVTPVTTCNRCNTCTTAVHFADVLIQTWSLFKVKTEFLMNCVVTTVVVQDAAETLKSTTINQFCQPQV